METATEVQLEESGFAQGGKKIPRTYKTTWGLGIFLLVSVWIWAAFIRGLGYTRPLQLLLVLCAVALAAGLGWLVARIVRRQFMLDPGDNGKLMAFSASAFLLLAVFLPE